MKDKSLNQRTNVIRASGMGANDGILTVVEVVVHRGDRHHESIHDLYFRFVGFVSMRIFDVIW